ncbi:hypothetical protein IEQ34_021399 [Dendrobium chrysotoxum]|uniref:Uncharacterized protein n=1 Tax=Dendrobium chrysotoxum TaxID=161865 RepID=A0AAV7G5G0_DENCH|nr:hypothetical protein IEQ34_021399 [Dendrobium chrysotoxum]
MGLFSPTSSKPVGMLQAHRLGFLILMDELIDKVYLFIGWLVRLPDYLTFFRSGPQKGAYEQGLSHTYAKWARAIAHLVFFCLY